MSLKLYIGNRNYSSWSMRPWIALKWSGLDFSDEVRTIGGDVPGYGQARAAHILDVSPSGRVPVLHAGGERIYDSLAICEWIGEQVPELWPAESGARAMARSACAEMHGGFMGLRRELPMNMRRRMSAPPPYPDDAARDIDRVFALWSGLRARFGEGGPFLFGRRSIADAFYAPVVSRLRTYAISGTAAINDYIETISSDAAYREWETAALKETWDMPGIDGIYP